MQRQIASDVGGGWTGALDLGRLEGHGRILLGVQPIIASKLAVQLGAGGNQTVDRNADVGLGGRQRPWIESEVAGRLGEHAAVVGEAKVKDAEIDLRVIWFDGVGARLNGGGVGAGGALGIRGRANNQAGSESYGHHSLGHGRVLSRYGVTE